MNRTRLGALVLSLTLILGGWKALHIELTESFPAEDQVVAEVPSEMWLRFSVEPDTARSSFSVRGPEGRVELGDVSVRESSEVLRAEVIGPMPAGEYTVSWIAAPLDDHTVRGRYGFTVEAAR